MQDTLGNIKYKIDHKKRILYAARYDELTKDRIFAEWAAMKELEGFNPCYESITDYSRVTRVDLDASDIMELSQEMTNCDPRTGHIAIVSGLKDGRYFLGRLFCVVANKFLKRKHQIFRSVGEAEAWLYSMREGDE